MAALPFPHPRQIPTEAEIRLARSVLEELEQSITWIESNIQELQTQLRSLRQQRANYVSYISPFRRIPPEILAEIALMCFHSGESLTKLTQINSTFRDAVTGTGSIWRRICLTLDGSVRPFRYHILDGSVGCETREQLEVILSRTNSAPLRLMTELTVDPGVLKPVSLYRHPIESLTVIGRFGMNPIINPFLDLNFDQLQELNLTRIAPDLVEGFMDLATMSTSKEIHLSLRRGRLTMSLLTHPFMQRITHLLISIDSHQLPSEFQYPMGVNISLPNVKSCIILYNSNLFEILDLEGVQDLGFIGLRTLQGGPNDRPLITRHPPEHVDRLKLKDCAINFSSESEDIPHLLPHLTELELEDVALLGPLHQHLNFPEIKSLRLYDVYYSQINNADRTMPIIDEPFFRTTPELEALYVRGTIMGNSLVRSLPDCTFLKILWFSNCSIDDFLILFLKRIQDKDFFPSLEVLSLVDSWGPEERIDYTVFVEHCNSKRPSLAVMGDGSPYRQP